MQDPKPLSRRTVRKRQRNDEWAMAAADWRLRSIRNGCQVCHLLGWDCSGGVQAHHWLYEQHIRRWVSAHAHESGMTPVNASTLERMLVWSPANGGGVCQTAHESHHNRTRPIPLWVVPLRAIQFAASIGLGHRIEEAYPA